MKAGYLIIFIMAFSLLSIAQETKIEEKNKGKALDISDNSYLIEFLLEDCGANRIKDVNVWMLTSNGEKFQVGKTNKHGFVAIDIGKLKNGLMLCFSKPEYYNVCLEKKSFSWLGSFYIIMTTVAYM